ncbi:MAG: homoserine kinase [Bacteroidetes bacterium HGW-Bacteroidetes-17]|jgi:homoserine kinase|nr:MAG: homoserine kinase [Bacteroidetes bacterium HGW-Bacteroidetes-17]
MERIVRAFAPASIANVSCGFDVLGMAICDLGDIVEVSSTYKNSIEIIEIVHGIELSYDVEKNSCGVVARKMLDESGQNRGVNIRIIKGYTSGSGLGSSAASSVATALAMNKFLNASYSDTKLVEFAMEGEFIACGTRHADNVAASMFGGISLVKELRPLEIVQLPVPENLFVSVLFPQFRLETSTSRNIISEDIKLKLASQQWGNLASFVSGLYQNDYELIGRSMKDVVAEKFRSILIPSYNEMKSEAMHCGALGFGISGSGPAVFALSHGRQIADQVKQAMEIAFQSSGIEYRTFVSEIRVKKAEIIKSGSKYYNELYKYQQQVAHF